MLVKILKKLFFINFFIKKLEITNKNRRKKTLSRIPIFLLKHENIKNCKLRLNRIEIFKELKKNSIGAELGVAYGEFSEQILKLVNPELLILIDSYPNDANYVDEGNISHINKKFENQIKEAQIKILYEDSIQAASKFKNEYFDWIYIDTTHQYDHTIKELYAWKDKIKKDGIILGHDYVMGNWVDSVKYGVQEAVHEFCFKEKWELIYLTAQIGETTTFGIKKIVT